ncbi:hypothetical protein EGW08_004096, partial [Elysia chlorotica]
MRVTIAELLIECGINVLMTRKDGRIAVEVMSVSDSIRNTVQNATDLAMAIERHKEPAKSSKAKPTQADQENPHPKQHARAGQTGQTRPTNSSSDAGPGANRRRECDECEGYLQNAQRSTNYRNLTSVYKDLVKVVKANHKQDERHRTLRAESIKLIARLLLAKNELEIPDCITDLKAVDFKELVFFAAEARKWAHLSNLVYKFKEQKGRDALSRFAETLSVDEVIEDADMAESCKDELVRLLVSHGAHRETALQKAAQENCWKVALTLLDFGANPSNLTLSEGDTPLHVAVTIALEKDP